MRTVPLVLLFSGLALANVSQDFNHILNGSEPLTQQTLDSMYEQFIIEFRGGKSSSQTFLNENRKAIFENKVRKMVTHNTDPT